MKTVPFAPYVARVQAWWMDRAPRERVLLAVLGVVATLALLIVLVVKPLQAAWGQALADIRTYETLSAGLAASGGRPAAGAAQGAGRSGPVAQILTTTAAGFGLTVQRVEPEGDRTRVVMDAVPYDAVLRWLADLESGGGLVLSEVRLDRGGAPGQVNVQLVVQGS